MDSTKCQHNWKTDWEDVCGCFTAICPQCGDRTGELCEEHLPDTPMVPNWFREDYDGPMPRVIAARIGRR